MKLTFGAHEDDKILKNIQRKTLVSIEKMLGFFEKSYFISIFVEINILTILQKLLSA